MPRDIRDKRELARVLHSARIQRNLTQQELAKALETNQPKLSAIERAVRPPQFDVLVDWIAVCGGRLDVLTAEDVDREGKGMDPLVRRLNDLCHRLSDQERAILDMQLDLVEARLAGGR